MDGKFCQKMVKRVETIYKGKHGGKLVCHLLQNLKVHGSNLHKD